MGGWGQIPEAMPYGMWSQKKLAMNSCSSTYSLHQCGLSPKMTGNISYNVRKHSKKLASYYHFYPMPCIEINMIQIEQRIAEAVLGQQCFL